MLPMALPIKIKILQRVIVTRTQEIGVVQSLSNHNATLRMEEDGRVIVVPQRWLRLYRERQMVQQEGTPEELKLAANLGLTVKQARKARK
jgi:hypothetical protein